MSYATYLRNKLDSQTKIIDNHKPTDASQHTTKKRFEATRTFFADGKGIGTLLTASDGPNSKPSAAYKKGTTRPADASTYTAYRGHIGVDDDSKYLRAERQIVEPCCDVPSPDPTKYKTAHDVTRDKLVCCVEPHDANGLDKPQFVDNTIRLSAMVPYMVSGECSISDANHTHSSGLPYAPQQFAATQHTFMAAPPEFQNQGIGGKRAGAYYNPRSGYVENKHGNDLRVNPRRVPSAFVRSNGAPVHLKINDPSFGSVKSMI